jgi:hypothetical protein
MIHRKTLRAILLFLLLIRFQICPAPAADPAVAHPKIAACLKRLDKPTLNNAVKCVSALDALASEQDGPKKKAVADLSTSIRTLFLAEDHLLFALEQENKANEEAAEMEKDAAHWLKKDSLGQTQPVMHRNQMNKADKIRSAATEKTKQSRAYLAYVIHRTDVALKNLAADGYGDLCRPVHAASNNIAARSLNLKPFTVRKSGGKTSRERNPEFDKQLLAVVLAGLALTSFTLPDSAADQRQIWDNKMSDGIKKQFEFDAQQKIWQHRPVNG